MAEENTSDTPRYMTHEEFNKALDARLGRAFGSFENKLSEQLSKYTMQPEQTPENVPDVEKLANKVKALEKENRDTRKAHEAEKLHNALSSALRGKVSDTWIDLATENLKKQSQIANGQAQIVFDSVPYGINEGVEHWLSQDENKRFLPAPKTSTQLKSPVSGYNRTTKETDAQIARSVLADRLKQSR